MNKLILLGVFFLVLLVVALTYSQRQINPPQQTAPIVQKVLNYEECMQSTNSKIVETFPQKCVVIDKDTGDEQVFIEQAKEPVDTSQWEKFNSGLGFSLLCPPHWQCQKYDEKSVIISQTHYLNISSFQLFIITPENFQQSFLRHPDYQDPISWYKDTLMKNPRALKVYPQTIKSVPGRDEQRGPQYAFFDFKTMSIFDAQGGKGLIFPVDQSDSVVIVPLDNQNLVLVVISPKYLTDDPIFKAIFASISKQ